MKLYSYFRSSAAYRVRIALNLKGLAFDTVPVHLLRDGGEQKHGTYKAINPLGVVPTLETEGCVFTQSLAIIEWLDEAYPEPALLPSTLVGRAHVRAIAQTIACDIHPLNNLRVIGYLTKTLGVSEEQKNAWYRHWVHEGLLAVEKLIADAPSQGQFSYGDAPTIADCCLVPQVFNARRFDCALDLMPRIRHIIEACEQLDGFQQAAPAVQFDCE